MVQRQAVTRSATPGDFDRALGGVDFPAPKARIVESAADKGGTNGEVSYILERIPERAYGSLRDVHDAVNAAYNEHKGLPPGEPVHPHA
jgi:hypothetical protein